MEGMLVIAAIIAIAAAALVVNIVILLIPWFIAKNRKVKNTFAIFWLGLLGLPTGGVSWIAALVWACVEKPVENKELK